MRAATRRTMVTVQKEVGDAYVGQWNLDPTTALSLGVAPFVKSREDTQVVLRSAELLPEGQPVEFSGFSLHRALRTAESMDSRADEETGGIRFADLASSHPVMVSFPPDLMWLAHPGPVVKFAEGIQRILPESELSSTPADSLRIALAIQNQLVASPQSFVFWRAAIRRDLPTHVPLTRYLIDFSIAVAARARAKLLAPMAPVIDSRTPNSVWLAHKVNLAFGDVIADRVNEGAKAPALLYALSFNPGVFEADSPSETLSTAERNASAALQSGLFEGIWVAIRGLPRISLSAGRVNSVLRLIRRLGVIARANDAPLWWSRAGLAGLAAADLGCAGSSFSLNLRCDDLYVDGGGMAGDYTQTYGKVLNPVARDLWEYRQVRRSLDAPEPGLADLGPCRHIPNELELASPSKYRVFFSKPYNLAAMNYLYSDWKAHIGQGETTPGREYLQTFSAPTNQWGLR